MTRKSKRAIEHDLDELEERHPHEASVAEYLSAESVEPVDLERGLVRLDGVLRRVPPAVREVVM